MKQTSDPTIEQIRETRHRISAEHGHDAEKLVNYYIELQKEYEHRQHSAESQKVYQTVKAQQVIGREAKQLPS